MNPGAVNTFMVSDIFPSLDVSTVKSHFSGLDLCSYEKKDKIYSPKLRRICKRRKNIRKSVLMNLIDS